MKKDKRTFVEKIIQEDEYHNISLTEEGCEISSYVFGTIAVGALVAAGVTMDARPLLATFASSLISYVSYCAAQEEKGKSR